MMIPMAKSKTLPRRANLIRHDQHSMLQSFGHLRFELLTKVQTASTSTFHDQIDLKRKEQALSLSSRCLQWQLKLGKRVTYIGDPISMRKIVAAYYSSTKWIETGTISLAIHQDLSWSSQQRIDNESFSMQQKDFEDEKRRSFLLLAFHSFSWGKFVRMNVYSIDGHRQHQHWSM